MPKKYPKKVIMHTDHTGTADRFQLQYKQAMIKATKKRLNAGFFGITYTRKDGVVKNYRCSLRAPNKALDKVINHSVKLPAGCFRCWVVGTGWRTFYYGNIKSIRANGFDASFNTQAVTYAN